MQQSSALYDPSQSGTPTERSLIDARRERLKRINDRALQPAPTKVDIVDSEPVETTIEVTTCTGQIVIVTEKQVAEARAVFERISSFGGSKFSIDEIQRAVCKRFGISRVDLIAQRRTKEFVTPRHLAMYLCKTMTFKSLPEIGRRFNGRDHTTVLSAVRKMAHLYQADETIRGVVNDIKAEIVGGVG